MQHFDACPSVNPDWTIGEAFVSFRVPFQDGRTIPVQNRVTSTNCIIGADYRKRKNSESSGRKTVEQWAGHHIRDKTNWG